VVGLGRYVGSNFIGLRSYLGPGDNALSKSFSLYSRFYLSDDRNDYFGLSAGTGVSPDDATRGVYTGNLKSFKSGIEYSRSIKKRLILTASGSYVNEEFRTSTYGSQFTLNAGVQHRF
jgi:YaiO family outer membrane protein